MPRTKKKEVIVKKEAVKKAVSNQTGLNFDVLDPAGKVVETLKLPENIFGGKVNPKLIAQAVRVYLVNQRQGTVSSKSRGEVEGSTRKIYRQKGTGRARHGGIRAPIFVKGGIAHGPKPKDYHLAMSQKMKRAAFLSALAAKVKAKEIKLVSGLESLEAKTKLFAEAFNAWGFNPKTRDALLVTPIDMENIYRSARNLTGVTIISANRLNTYQIMQHKAVILMKDAIESIEKVFGSKRGKVKQEEENN